MNGLNSSEKQGVKTCKLYGKRTIFNSIFGGRHILKLILFFSFTFLCQSQNILWQKNLSASAFEFHPSNIYFAVAYGGGVTIRDIQTGTEIKNIKEMKNDGALSLCFSRDGKYLAGVSYQGRVFVWDTDTWDELEIDNLSRPLNEVKYSPDGKYLAVAGRQNGMLLYDTKSWQRIDKWNEFPVMPGGLGRAEISNVSFRFDSKVLAITSNQANQVRLYDIETKKRLDTLFFDESAKFSPVRNELLSIKLYHADNHDYTDGFNFYHLELNKEPEHLKIIPSSKGPSFDFSFSSSGNYIVIAGAGGALGKTLLYSLNNWREIYKFELSKDFAFYSPRIANNERYLATVSGDIYMIDLGAILSVNEPRLIENFNVTPNPANDNVLIVYTLKIPGHVEIKISNINGSINNTIKSEFQTEKQYSEVYHLADFPNGTYFITLKINEKFYSQKINIVR